MTGVTLESCQDIIEQFEPCPENRSKGMLGIDGEWVSSEAGGGLPGSASLSLRVLRGPEMGPGAGQAGPHTGLSPALHHAPIPRLH